VRPLTVLAVLLTALALWAGPAAAREPAVTVPAGAALTITGHGYGHGHGMSQYGAEDAARQGLTATQIAEFYYPHTTWGAAGGQIKVLIGADTTPDVVVVAQPGLVAQQVGTSTTWDLAHLQPDATRWRIVPRGRGRSALAWRLGRAWHRLVAVPGTLQFSAGDAPVGLVEPDRSVRHYRGALRSAVPQGASYVQGVVPQEVPALWQPAAVQAQAIAARTFAAYQRAHAGGHDWYDICDTWSCQAYGGYDAEQPASTKAVAATRSQVLLYDGTPALTQFSSSSGGWTAAGGTPYLPAEQDPYDAASGNPNHTWHATVTAAQIQRYWPALGTLQSIQVTRRDGHGQWGGRVLSLTLTGSDGAVTVSGETFRAAWGLKSTWFRASVGS
jgi:stage II sporulation protein D